MRWFIAADRRAQFEKLEYTEDDYEKELEHIEKVRTLLYQNGHP
jgi:(E)-4-hydroxy-3-methylbut-2-enyl-diphosphate synthase